MANEHIDNLEERMIVLHDKAAREGFSVPDEVIEYIAEKYALATTLKGALINVQAYASRKGVPVTLGVARLVLDGIREQPAPPAPVEEPTPVVASFEPDVVVPEEQWEPEVAPAQPAPTAVQPASGGSIVPAPEETEWGGTPKPALGLEPQPAAPAPQPVAAPQPATPTPADEPAFLGGAAPAAGPDPEITGTLFTPPPPVTPAQPAVPAAATPPAQPAPQPAAPQPATPPAPQPAPQLPPATVWFAPMRSAKKESLVKRAGELLKRAGLNDAIEDGDLVAVKLHFGEEGNTGFVHPVFLRETVRRIRKAGGKPFLTDANTLYRGKRANAVDHLTCATRNGFSFSTINAPVVIADGLTGADGVEVPISGFDHFDSVKIGAAAVHADAMVVVTHVKGHEATGFGGAMKNVGMGLGTRAAKQRMHSDLKPQVNAEKCTACKRCVKSCPVNAIEIHHKVAVIDYDLCYGCGECVAACPYGAIGIQWKTEPDAIQEKIVEHCAGAVAGKEGKVVYLSFITNVSPDCDCWSFSDAAIVRDIGVLASTDLVAIDQAAYDLVTQATGLAGGRGEGMAAGDDKFKIITGIDGTRAMAYAEKHGLGTRRYELKQLD